MILTFEDLRTVPKISRIERHAIWKLFAQMKGVSVQVSGVRTVGVELKSEIYHCYPSLGVMANS